MVGFLIAAAFAAGYVLGGLREDVAPERKTRGQVPVAPAAERTAAPDSMASWIDGLAVDPPAKGSGKIVGRVTDAAGEPVSGVIVVVTANRPRSNRKGTKAPAGPTESPIAEDVARYAKRQIRRRLGRRQVRTDADGMYAATGLAATSYRIDAYAKGYQLRATGRASQWRVKPGSELNFVARPIVRLYVDVRLSGGGRPEAADIRWTFHKSNGGTTGSSDRWSPSSRWIELAPGTYTLRAVLRDESEAASAEKRVVVSIDKAMRQVIFSIAVKPRLRVDVVPPPSFELPTVQAMLVRFSGDKPPADDILKDSSRNNAIYPDDGGVTHWKNLEPARYLAGAAIGHNGKIFARQVVDVAAGDNQVVLRMPTPDPADHVLVQAFDPEGGELKTGVQWSLEFRGKRRNGSSGTTALRRSDGVIFLAQLENYKGIDGEHYARALHSVYGSARAKVVPGSGSPVAVRFEKPATVEVTISNYKGSGREGRLSLSLEDKSGSGRSHGSPIDADGKASFGPVQPGEFGLRLRIRGSAFSGASIASKPLALRSGKQSADIAIPELHDLKVTWTGEGRPTFMLSRSERGFGRSPSAKTDAKGVGIIRDLVAGDYFLTVANVKSDIRGLKVSIPATKELVLP